MSAINNRKGPITWAFSAIFLPLRLLSLLLLSVDLLEERLRLSLLRRSIARQQVEWLHDLRLRRRQAKNRASSLNSEQLSSQLPDGYFSKN